MSSRLNQFSLSSGVSICCATSNLTGTLVLFPRCSFMTTRSRPTCRSDLLRGRSAPSGHLPHQAGTAAGGGFGHERPPSRLGSFDEIGEPASSGRLAKPSAVVCDYEGQFVSGVQRDLDLRCVGVPDNVGEGFPDNRRDDRRRSDGQRREG